MQAEGYCAECGGYHNPPLKNKHKVYAPKVRKVMHEFKHGTLHSGSKHGPRVRSRRQAVAIALAEARKGRS